MSTHPKDAPASEDLGGLLRHTSIYAIAPVFQRVLAIGLVALYTRKLSTGEYGLLELLDVFLGLLPLLVGTSLVSGLTRHYFLHDDPRDQRAVVSSTAIALVSLAWVGAGVALLLRAPLSEFLFAQHEGGPPGALDLGQAAGLLAPFGLLSSGLALGLQGELASVLAATRTAALAPGFVDLLIASTLVVPFAVGTRVGIEYLQVQKRSRRVVEVQVSKTTLEAALKLVALYVLDWGVLGFILSMLVGEALYGTALIAWTLRRAGSRFDWGVFRPLVVYALPLLPVGLFQMALHQADRLMILHLGPQTAVPDGNGGTERIAEQWNGIYGLGYKIPFLFHVAVLYSFMRIWQPHLFGLKEDGRRRAETRRIGSLVAAGLGFAYAQVAIYAPEGVRILGQQEGYHAADAVVPIVACAYLLYALHSLGQAALMSVLATRILAWINGLALALNLALNAWLIPAFGDRGYLGAAVATLGTFAFLAVAITAAASRRLATPFQPGVAVRATAWVLAATAASVLLAARFEPWTAAGLAAKVGLSLLLAAGMWRTCLDAGSRRSLAARLRRT